jgi:8-oxo-dGTP pyrophosphatase MutT (NUDIX family)
MGNEIITLTLLYLVRRDESGNITHIALAKKARGFGSDKMNGYGGKLKDGESIEEAALRETREESTVICESIQKIAELGFIFSDNPNVILVAHTFISDKWIGDTTGTEEMGPAIWYALDEIPYDGMWPADSLWLRRALEGEYVKAEFHCAENGEVINLIYA